MPWRKADFKGQQVWAQVDAAGEPVREDGRVPVRYAKTAGAKVYLASAARVAVRADAAVEDLPYGTDAGDAGGAKTSSGTGAKPGRASAGKGFGKAGTRTREQAQAAQDDAASRLARLSPDTTRCFTDGACKGNPGPAGSGVVVVLPDGRRAEAARSLGRATNNIAELTAIAIALDLLERAEVSPIAPVVVFTDSSYSEGVLKKGWKAKANTDLILDLRARLRARTGTRLEWVAGHVGVVENERADQLANAGVAGRTFATPFAPVEPDADASG